VSKLIEGLRIAITSIFINKMRAGLTMLGIIIGVAAVISLISLGRGVQKYVADQFQAVGANLLVVNSARPQSTERTRIDPLTDADVEALLDNNVAPSIEDIAPQFNATVTITTGAESMRTGLRGVTVNHTRVRNWEPESGQFITQQHIDEQARVAVIGPQVVEELWDDTYDPVGEIVRINNQTYNIIGVMESRDDPGNNDDAAILVPITTAQSRLSDGRVRGGMRVDVLYVRAWDTETSYTAEEEIDRYLYETHDIEAEDQKDYNITNLGAQLEIAGTITAMLTVFLGMVAGVSLLVGGIGIMNIMLVTVTERTQEIGLRKAVGAEPSDILWQFLFESTVLSLIGGLSAF
jgi:putative ABC transport system permease protein